MTATERLRELLDERGVEWAAPDESWNQDSITYWKVGSIKWVAFESENGTLWLNCNSVTDLTPSQAIAATLGAGTCHPIISDNLTESEGTGDAWADCSECGHLLYVLTDPNSEPPNYCPNCGRKVIG